MTYHEAIVEGIRIARQQAKQKNEVQFLIAWRVGKWWEPRVMDWERLQLCEPRADAAIYPDGTVERYHHGLK